MGADVGEIAKTPTSLPRLAHVSKSDKKAPTSRPRLDHVLPTSKFGENRLRKAPTSRSIKPTSQSPRLAHVESAYVSTTSRPRRKCLRFDHLSTTSRPRRKCPRLAHVLPTSRPRLAHVFFKIRILAPKSAKYEERYEFPGDDSLFHSTLCFEREQTWIANQVRLDHVVTMSRLPPQNLNFGAKSAKGTNFWKMS